MNSPAQAIEYERELDGRWIAEMPSIPGVMAYGTTKEEARRCVLELADDVFADRRAHDETTE